MKVTDVSTNTKSGGDRQPFESTPPSAGSITNVSQADNSPTLMNTPEPKERGFRADQLVEMAGDDAYRLTPEAARMDKIKG